VVSQTFADSEMLALESLGYRLDIASLNPPGDAFRHERYDDFEAEVLYPPPTSVLKAWQQKFIDSGEWQQRLGAMIARHDRDYGPEYKAETRARNAVYFAELLKSRGVRHIHVHFANRATHTALFIKQWSDISFSFTAHAQDFMVDIGSDDLLREMCAAAEFTVAVSDHSRDLLRNTCPDSAQKIDRIYNGIRPADFPLARDITANRDRPLRIITIGRLIEFKGFHHLLAACARLRARGIPFELCIIGEGPWRGQLEQQAADLGIDDAVEFAGVQSGDTVKLRLADSDVFALACIVDEKGASDILPTVIMEAMTCGLPVVSTQLVGVPEMVAHEETGILVEPGDEDALAQALEKLSQDRELAARLGKAGSKRALQLFDQRVTSRQLAEKFDVVPLRTPVEHANASVDKPRDTAWLFERWPGNNDPSLADELSFFATQWSDRVQLIAAGAPESKTPIPQILLPAFEVLPDAIVLEAEWRHHPGAADQLAALHRELGGSGGGGVSGEDFMLQARRALHLDRIFKKRGIRHVHAARSDLAVCAWLLHRRSGYTLSVAIESEPVIGKKAIRKIADEAIYSSLADVEGEDRLELRNQPRTRQIRLGPIKLRVPRRWKMRARSPLYQRWISQLRVAAGLSPKSRREVEEAEEEAASEGGAA
jgi:glycosyltransferase involved in cell wall biosynthesis